MNFRQQITTAQALNNSMLCVGLDPEPSTFRRMLQDIGKPDHPKRLRHSGSLEAIERSLPFQCFQEPER